MSGLNSSGVGALDQSASVVNFANGYYTGDGSGSVVAYVGFTPRYVKVIDMSATSTAIMECEFIEGMAATNTLTTTAAGVPAANTSSLITTNGTVVTYTEVAYGGNGVGDGTQGTVSVAEEYDNKQGVQLTFGSGLNVSTNLYVWVAFG